MNVFVRLSLDEDPEQISNELKELILRVVLLLFKKKKLKNRQTRARWSVLEGPNER